MVSVMLQLLLRGAEHGGLGVGRARRGCLFGQVGAVVVSVCAANEMAIQPTPTKDHDALPFLPRRRAAGGGIGQESRRKGAHQPKSGTRGSPGEAVRGREMASGERRSTEDSRNEFPLPHRRCRRRIDRAVDLGRHFSLNFVCFPHASGGTGAPTSSPPPLSSPSSTSWSPPLPQARREITGGPQR